jgi:uncharacterized protein
VKQKPLVINLNPDRVCGPCTLCCKVMGVHDGDFNKPKDQWCVHTKKGVGCTIYADRPAKCRGFECLWLQHRFGGPEHRPDKIHGVVTPTSDGENWAIHEDPGYPGVARAALQPYIDYWLNAGRAHYVIIVNGDRRTFLGDAQTYATLQQRGMPEVAGAQNVKITQK